MIRNEKLTTLMGDAVAFSSSNSARDINGTTQVDDGPAIDGGPRLKDLSERTVSSGGSIVWANCTEARLMQSYRRSCNSLQRECPYIVKLFKDMKCALRCLNGEAADEEIESWAVMIHESMSRHSRYYHNIQHIFDVSDCVDPIQLFATFFHDVIYYNVDEGLSPRQTEILQGVAKFCGGHCCLCEDIDSHKDPELAMVVSIFGLSPGDKLCPRVGCMNEFLSAVVAVRLLKNALSLSTLAQIAVGIEATIPFRKIDENGDSPMDRLYQRLVLTNESHQLGLSHNKVINAIQRAADISNRNCGSFAMARLSSFLACTWRLLPEFSPALRQSHLYTIYDYTLAVQRMEIHLHNLDPSLLFTSFRGLPQDWEVTDFNQRAKMNLTLAKKYIRATIMTLAIVEAICQFTGGNGPMCFFFGDLPSRTNGSARLSDGLPKLKRGELARDCDEEVYNALTESCFDANESSVAAFVYGKMGESGIISTKAYAKVPMDKHHAMALLSFVPHEVLFHIAKSMERFTMIRTEAIENLLEAIDQSPSF